MGARSRRAPHARSSWTLAGGEVRASSLRHQARASGGHWLASGTRPKLGRQRRPPGGPNRLICCAMCGARASTSGRCGIAASGAGWLLRKPLDREINGALTKRWFNMAALLRSAAERLGALESSGPADDVLDDLGVAARRRARVARAQHSPRAVSRCRSSAKERRGAAATTRPARSPRRGGSGKGSQARCHEGLFGSWVSALATSRSRARACVSRAQRSCHAGDVMQRTYSAPERPAWHCALRQEPERRDGRVALASRCYAVRALSPPCLRVR